LKNKQKDKSPGKFSTPSRAFVLQTGGYPVMQDDITLIEKIHRNQTEVSADLELLKNKENEQYTEDIEAIQRLQSEVAAEVEKLQNKIQQDKNGGAK
jgi:hypothetical protein